VYELVATAKHDFASGNCCRGIKWEISLRVDVAPCRPSGRKAQSDYFIVEVSEYAIRPDIAGDVPVTPAGAFVTSFPSEMRIPRNTSSHPAMYAMPATTAGVP
jgi:hypothetical protein